MLLAAVSIAVATSSSDVAAILAFAGALLVALLTAVTTSRRQEAQLAAEERRLEMELKHDSSVRDVAHVREVIDAVLVDVTRARTHASAGIDAYRSGDMKRKEAHSRAAGLRVIRDDLDHARDRVSVRFDPTHPVEEAMAEIHAAYAALVDFAIGLLVGAGRSSKAGSKTPHFDQRQYIELSWEAGAAHRYFTYACQLTVGASVAPKPDAAKRLLEYARPANPHATPVETEPQSS